MATPAVLTLLDMQARSLRPKRILVATDLDDLEGLARVALDEALRFGAEVLFLHVLPDFLSPSMAPSLLVYIHPEQHRQYAETRLLSTVREAEAQGVRCSWEFANGKVADAIADRVGQWGPDQVIVGSHGHAKFSLRILGSMAEKLFRSLPVPVVAVGPGSYVARIHRWPKRVLVPFSLAAGATSLLPLAALMSALPEFRVSLLHLIESHDPETASAIKQRGETMVAHHFGAAASERLTSILVPRQDVSEAIVKEAACGEFDLVLIGKLSAASSAPEVTVHAAYNVLCAAPCPVMVLNAAPSAQ